MAREFFTRLALAGMVVGALTLAPAAPAAAAGELQVSADGSAYGFSLSTPVFQTLGAMVPGDSQASTVYVRNTGDEAGFLRIVLADVQYSDLDLANALTIQASVLQDAGAPTPVSLAEPCWVLNEGQTLAPGQSARIDLTAVLGNLDGTLGQGGTVRATLAANLSDMTPGSLPPTECGTANIAAPLLPGTSGTAPSGGTGAPSAPALTTTAPDAASPSTPETGDLPVLNLPGGFTIDPNTWQLWEEWLVLFLFVSTAIGATWYVVVTRRRNRRQSEEASEALAPGSEVTA